MGRGKAFHSKKKGHEPQPPKHAQNNKVADEHHLEDLPELVTLEAYKNSLKKG
ncbi:hypothetical protein P6P90_10575 [Ectobacillus antri]|jgi:hypothetical protein|uniref:YfhD family protein n=1 Tax=Ectobacillus antri TaxID=2486280 RepID=A0ABT6H6W0_9BACI|nr:MULTISPECIES: hypothetical protein [Ectobacillus]MDG4657233.1 hypothetical protein [Ectobacillus antri]MDG5754415.1 hypothetical protein [Ectobacillus antri]UOY91795.1 hypothetical protein MUG87_15035 [Ectobacillus sp. JY-23]